VGINEPRERVPLSLVERLGVVGNTIVHADDFARLDTDDCAVDGRLIRVIHAVRVNVLHEFFWCPKDYSSVAYQSAMLTPVDRETEEELRERVDVDELERHVDAFDGTERVSGTDDEWEASEYVVETLREYGCEAELLDFEGVH